MFNNVCQWHGKRKRSPLVKKIHHATIINWIKQVGDLLPNSYYPDRIPQVGELDELETFVGKKNKIWISTAVDHFNIKSGYTVIAKLLSLNTDIPLNTNLKIFKFKSFLSPNS